MLFRHRQVLLNTWPVHLVLEHDLVIGSSSPHLIRCESVETSCPEPNIIAESKKLNVIKLSYTADNICVKSWSDHHTGGLPPTLWTSWYRRSLSKLSPSLMFENSSVRSYQVEENASTVEACPVRCPRNAKPHFRRVLFPLLSCTIQEDWENQAFNKSCVCRWSDLFVYSAPLNFSAVVSAITDNGSQADTLFYAFEPRKIRDSSSLSFLFSILPLFLHSVIMFFLSLYCPDGSNSLFFLITLYSIVLFSKVRYGSSSLATVVWTKCLLTSTINI